MSKFDPDFVAQVSVVADLDEKCQKLAITGPTDEYCWALTAWYVEHAELVRLLRLVMDYQ
jgi:hypothetical protein